jgi:rhodanese-related sulfurtransferase
MRSMQVANFLLSKGFKSLFNLQGGIDAWSKEIDSSVERY